ncbi:unnamed protein product, partial [Fusarium graminearum]
WLNTGNKLFQNQPSQDLILKPALLNQHTAIYHDTADLSNKIRLLDTGEMIQLAWENGVVAKQTNRLHRIGMKEATRYARGIVEGVWGPRQL